MAFCFCFFFFFWGGGSFSFFLYALFVWFCVICFWSGKRGLSVVIVELRS